MLGRRRARRTSSITGRKSPLKPTRGNRARSSAELISAAAATLLHRSAAHFHLVHGGSNERDGYSRKRLLNTLPVTFVSPSVASIKVKRRGDVRRAKLYYLRERSGKSARIKEKI